MNRFSGACTDADIKAAATDVLNTWKKAIREQKEKRKREEEEKGGSTAAGTPSAEEGRDAKRVKAESMCPKLQRDPGIWFTVTDCCVHKATIPPARVADSQMAQLRLLLMPIPLHQRINPNPQLLLPLHPPRRRHRHQKTKTPPSRQNAKSNPSHPVKCLSTSLNTSTRASLRWILLMRRSLLRERPSRTGWSIGSRRIRRASRMLCGTVRW